MKEKEKINEISLGFALGFLMALAILVLGLVARFFNWGNLAVEIISSVYKGFSTSVLGIVTGVIWAFIDNFVGGVILAWLYNQFQKIR